MCKNGQKWTCLGSRIGENDLEKNSSPVSNILSNFYFKTQVIIASQSALNRYPNHYTCIATLVISGSSAEIPDTMEK